MTDDEMDKAHEIHQIFDSLVVAIGTDLLRNLTVEQQEYIIIKMHDEFRFWRIEDELK